MNRKESYIDFRETMLVNEVPVRLQPYTELRFKQLLKADEYLDKLTKKYPDHTFRTLPRHEKAEVWMLKAKVLWEPHPELGDDGQPTKLNAEFWDSKNQFFTKSFFADPGFEYPLLKKTLIFFINQEVFL